MMAVVHVVLEVYIRLEMNMVLVHQVWMLEMQVIWLPGADAVGGAAGKGIGITGAGMVAQEMTAHQE